MAAAANTGASKWIWRIVLALVALFLIGVSIYVTLAFMSITHMYFYLGANLGTFLLISGMIGTPPLIGLAIAAALLKPVLR